MLTPILYSQNSPQWKNSPLGTTGRTIGSDGCAVTCVSMALSQYQINKNPQEVVQALKGHGGIAASGDITWTAITPSFPGVFFHWRQGTTLEDKYSTYRIDPKVAMAKIAKLLALGQPVILRTIINGFGHFVLAKEILDNDFLVNDPVDGQQRTFSSRYGDVDKNLMAYVVLIGGPTATADNVSQVTMNDIRASAGHALHYAARKDAHKQVVDAIL